MANKSSRRSGQVSGLSASRRNRLKRKLRKSADARPLVCGSLIAANWDPNFGLSDNYRRLGLCRDPNTESLLKIARRHRQRLVGSDDASDSETSAPDPNPIAARLQELGADPPRRTSTMPKSMPVQEQTMMAALVQAHGDDVEGMARDLRRNRFQKTAAQLRPRLRLYRALQDL